MKRIALAAIALLLILSLCACGNTDSRIGESDEVSMSNNESDDSENVTTTESNEESEAAQDDIWQEELTRDEFGDITDDSQEVIAGQFTGTFSNTATSESELSVAVLFTKNSTQNHYIAQFSLFEYMENIATYTSSSETILKIKIDDVVSEYNLYGEAPNGSLYLGLNDYDYSADYIFDELYTGHDVRCIITIDSSTYNFTIPSQNITSVGDDIGFGYIYPGLTTSEAIDAYLLDSGNRDLQTAAQESLVSHLDDYELLGSSELAELFADSTFLNILSATGMPYEDRLYLLWYIDSYFDGQAQILAEITVDEYHPEYGRIGYDVKLGAIVRDIIINEQSYTDVGKSTNEYQIYKISDNIYLKTNDEIAQVFIKLGDEASFEASINGAIAYIRNNYIAQIDE